MPTATENEVPHADVTHAPSQTAAATATMRALAAHDPREDVRGPDVLAEVFLTEEQRAPLRDERTRAWVLQNKVAPGAYEFMIARTAWFDEVTRRALEAGTPQVVLLGAGYDSRAYRFAPLLTRTRVFELDAPPTQARKQELLAQAGVAIPSNVRYVPIDLAGDDLKVSLLDAGFVQAEQALFLWEGVTYYLTRDTVDRTLAAVRDLAAPGSSIAFDLAILSPDALSEDGIKKLRQQMSTGAAAEPTRFGIPEGMLEAFLSRRGFAIRERLVPEDMHSRYLTLRDGSRIGSVPALFNLVLAERV
jgi:methyltransferase (TIGR00027 family)